MNPTTMNPIQRIIDRQGYMVLDGGLATTLEAHGHDLNDELWSARVLMEEPGAIGKVHRDFLEAGADCLITASYQASLEGFARRGLDAGQGAQLIASSVDLAVATKQSFMDGQADGRSEPLIAASVGPYGAFLADGSEYTGSYDIDQSDLYAFHRERWRILADSPADLLACETIPSLRETAVLLMLLADTPDRWAWFSFSCRDGIHLNDGNRLSDAVRLCTAVSGVAAVGVNCTAPEHVTSLINEVRRVSSRPLLVYPNRGEEYHAPTKSWRVGRNATAWETSVCEWRAAGAEGIGGCCRIGPREIALTRRALAGE